MGNLFHRRRRMLPYMMPPTCPYHTDPYSNNQFYPYYQPRDYFNQNCNHSAYPYPYMCPSVPPSPSLYGFDSASKPMLTPRFNTPDFSPPPQQFKRQHSTTTYQHLPSSHYQSTPRSHFVDTAIQTTFPSSKENHMNKWLRKEEKQLKHNISNLRQTHSSRPIHSSRQVHSSRNNHSACQTPEINRTKWIRTPNNSNNKSRRPKSLLELGYTINSHGKHCYRCFIPYKSEKEWELLLRKAKHSLIGLQNIYKVTIYFSKRIYMFRGTPIRTVDIVGNHKVNVSKCRSALPDFINKILITELNEDNNFGEKALTSRIHNRISKLPFKC